MQPHISPNLLEEFNKGNNKIRGKVCALLIPNITEIIRDRMGISYETADEASEIIVRFLKHSEPFETMRHLENYVEKITNNYCKDELRKKKKRTLNAKHVTSYLQNLQSRTMENARNIRICQRLTELAIEMLPPKGRQVYLYYLEGMTSKQIAEQMGISERTVEDHKYSAFEKLRIGYHNKPGNMGRYIVAWLTAPFLIFYILLQKYLS